MSGNDEKKLRNDLTEKELEVARANIRAWNCWGRTWRLAREQYSPAPYILRLMKTRTLNYQKVYFKMISSLGGLESKSILDVGCGTSDYLKWLANDCKTLVGVDISVQMLKLCRYDMGKSNIELVAADALHLPFRDEVFDASITFQALHHFPDWKKSLIEMMRTSRQVSLYEPNGDSLLHRLMDLVRKKFRVEQRFEQTDEAYELVEFQASGFSPKRIINFLNEKGMNAKALMFDVVPVSLLEKASSLSSRLLRFILTGEDLLRKLPILRDQLGNILIIGWKTNHQTKIMASFRSREEISKLQSFHS